MILQLAKLVTALSFSFSIINAQACGTLGPRWTDGQYEKHSKVIVKGTLRGEWVKAVDGSDLIVGSISSMSVYKGKRTKEYAVRYNMLDSFMCANRGVGWSPPESERTFLRRGTFFLGVEPKGFNILKFER